MNITQIWIGDSVPNKYQRCMDSVRAIYPDANVLKVPLDPKYTCQNPETVQCDVLRLEMACEDPNMLYLDCDIELLKPFEFDPTTYGKKPYMEMYLDLLDTPLIYVNGRTDFYHNLLGYIHRTFTQGFGYGFARKALKQHTPNVYPIVPGDTYIHHRFLSINPTLKESV